MALQYKTTLEKMAASVGMGGMKIAGGLAAEAQTEKSALKATPYNLLRV